MPDNTTEIARIRALLASGAKFVTTDGTQVALDPETLRIELRRLVAEDDTLKGRRPVAASIKTNAGP